MSQPGNRIGGASHRSRLRFSQQPWTFPFLAGFGRVHIEKARNLGEFRDTKIFANT